MDELERPSDELKRLYQEMYDLTAPVCATCPEPNACCSPEYCFLAKVWAVQAWDESIQIPAEPQKNRATGVVIPLLGERGCTALPHQRPTCTAHVCEVMREQQSEEWLQKWDDLHDRIQEIEFTRLMGTFAAGKIV